MICCTGLPLSAQTVYEPLNYTSGNSLVGASNGTGFSGAWLGSGYTVGTGSLAYSSLTTAGNSVSGVGESYRYLSSTYGGDGNSVWFGVLLNVSAATSGSSYAGVYFGQSGGANFMGLGNNGSGTSVLGVSTAINAGTALDSGSTTAFSLGTTYLLVLNFNFTSATTGTYQFYVNPTNSSSPGTAVNTSPIAFNLSGSGNDLVGFWSNGATATYDELRLGSSYASVVPGLAAIPEPSVTAALAAATALGLAALRRARRSGA